MKIRYILYFFCILAAFSVPAAFSFPTITQQGAPISILNDPNTGTIANGLATLTNANPAKAITAPINATSGIIGVVVGGAGIYGAAVIQTVGQVNCIFDNATTAADFVNVSSTTAGYCHDAGSAPVSSAIGIVLSTNTTSGTYTIVLNPPAVATGGGVTGIQVGGDIGGTNASPTVTNTHLTSALPVSQGGTGCQQQAGTTMIFANLPVPTNNASCLIFDAPSCVAGTAVTTGGGSTACSLTWNGTNWFPAAGAIAPASGGFSAAGTGLTGAGATVSLTSPVAVANGGTGATSSGVTAAHNIGAVAQGFGDVNNLDQVVNTHISGASAGQLAAFGGAGSLVNGGTALTTPLSQNLPWNSDPTAATTNIQNVNTSAWLDPASFGAQLLTTQWTATSIVGNTINITGHDFKKNEGIAFQHGGAAGSLGGVPLSSITAPALTEYMGNCEIPGQINTPFTTTDTGGWAHDMMVAYQWNTLRLGEHGSITSTGQYTVAPSGGNGLYTFTDDAYTPLRFCYALTTPTTNHAGSATLYYKVAILDGLGGSTAVSSTSLGGLAWVLPTDTNPAFLTFRAPDFTNTNAYNKGDLINPRSNNSDISITSIAQSGGTMTVTVGSNPYLAGDVVTLTDIIGNTNLNGGKGSNTDNGTFTVLASPAPTGTTFAVTNGAGVTCSSICGKIHGNNWYVVTKAGTSDSSPPNWMNTAQSGGTGCPGVGQICQDNSDAVEFTNIGIPPGFAIWTSIDGVNYKYERVVWSDAKTCDLGSSTDDSPYCMVDWGNRSGNSWDISTNTPPTGTGAFNYDNLLTTVTSIATNSITVAATPGTGNVTGTQAIRHDGGPALNSLWSFCASQAANNRSCTIKIGIGTLPVYSNLLIPSNLNNIRIEGQDAASSIMDFLGNGTNNLLGHIAGNCYSATPAGGGQIQNFYAAASPWIKDITMTGDNSAADTMYCGSGHWAGIDIEHGNFNVGSGSYMHRAFRLPGGGGQIWGTFAGFYNDITTDQANGLILGGPGYTAFGAATSQWPAVFLYAPIEYCTNGQGPWSVLGAVFEDSWNLIRPCSADGGTGGNITGGFMDGITAQDYSNGTTTNLVNGIANGSVAPEGIGITVIGSTNIRDTGNFFSSGPTAKVGGFWFHNTLAVTGVRSLMDGVEVGQSSTGVIAEVPVTIRGSVFAPALATAGLPLSGIGIAASTSGTVLINNAIRAQTGAMATAYQIGYQNNDTARPCNTGDPFNLTFNTGANFISQVSTTLNLCSTSNVIMPFSAPLLTLSGGTGTITDAHMIGQVNCSCRDTITFANGCTINPASGAVTGTGTDVIKVTCQ